MIGCIADDFTGATDVANMFARGGMRTILLTAADDLSVPNGVEAIVVAHKTRSIPACDAVSESIGTAERLLAIGIRQLYFKYCSTFDSTADGNIGPVTEALMKLVNQDFSVICPAFPGAGRTVYMAHLFVNDRLLSDTHMRHHPITPMQESDLRSLMSAQTVRPVGAVTVSAFSDGPADLDRAVRMQAARTPHVVVDTLDDDHLDVMGKAFAEYRLVTGGSGLALGLARARTGGLHSGGALDVPKGRSLILAGSCSDATLEQIEGFRGPSLRVLPNDIERDPSGAVDAAITWIGEQAGSAALIYTSAGPEDPNRGGSGEAIELFHATVARRAVTEAEVRRLIVAGGETSGAVTRALNATRLEIGEEINPGVPWTIALTDPKIALVLKSGNFGGRDFFHRTLERLDQA